MAKYLIVGLGNPGEEYERSRHNIGWMVADELTKDVAEPFTAERYGFVRTMRYKGRILIVLKPTTFMNLSGKAVRYWLDKENIPLENLLVISDDLDLDLGRIRIKTKGSGGSHNGLNNIIETLNTQQFSRMRFGIGHNFNYGEQIDYVLGKISDDEMKNTIQPRLEIAAEAIKSFVTAGPSFTMSNFNSK